MGSGHAFDMINKVKYNNSLQRSYKTRYTHVKEAYQKELGSDEIHHLRKSNISAKELQDIRHSIRETIRRERQIAFVKTLIIFILVIGILTWLFYKYIVESNWLF